MCPRTETGLRAPADLDAWADVLLGAALAGMAIENSMLERPTRGQSAHGPLWRHPWACRRPDVAGRGAIQRPGPGGGAALSPVGPARRTDRPAVRQRRAGRGEHCPILAAISRMPACRDRLPASMFPTAILSSWPRMLPSNGRELQPATGDEPDFAELYREILAQETLAKPK